MTLRIASLAIRAPLILATILLAVLTPRALADAPIRFTLDNGLRVILRPVDGTDEAAILVCFNFGENADPDGKSGLTHFIEHLYLTAAAGEAPSRTLDDIVGRYQGLFNAQTGEDYTVFATIVPAADLETELADAAARMAGIRITQPDVDRERPRILLELNNMYGGITGLGALNRAREALRPSPPGARKGGASDVIETLSLEELQLAADRWYKPSNAYLVVTGAMDAARARTSIETLFNPIPAGDTPQTRARTYADQPATITLEPANPDEPGVVVLAYPCPPAGRPHSTAAMLVVSRLIAAAQASGAFTGRFPPPVFHPVLDDPYLLYVGATLNEGESPEAAIARLDKSVADAFEGPVQTAERIAARNGVGMFLGFVDPPQGLAAQGLYGLAFSLARRAQLDIDPETVATALEQTNEREMLAAREAVFNPGRRSAVVISPTPKPPATDDQDPDAGTPSNGPGGS